MKKKTVENVLDHHRIKITQQNLWKAILVTHGKDKSS